MRENAYRQVFLLYREFAVISVHEGRNSDNLS